MKKLLKFFCLTVIALAFFFEGIGQSAKKLLEVGDVCPDLVMEHVINYSTKNAKISDFRGKLLILDFWATWCSPCIKNFPKNDSLQKIFGDKILILPVTYEKGETVSKFLGRANKNGRQVSVVEDVLLTKAFKHSMIPHYVWIDAQGKIIAFSDGDALNTKNIATALKAEPLAIKMKMDRDRKREGRFFYLRNSYKDGDSLRFSNMSDSILEFQSIITKYNPGFQNCGFQDTTYISLTNFSIFNIYQHIVGKFSREYILSPKAKVLIETADTSKIVLFDENKNFAPSKMFATWAVDNTFCYELRVPREMEHKKWDIALEDVNRYFGALYNIEGKMEKRKAMQYSLIRTSNNDKITTTSKEFENSVDQYHLKLVGHSAWIVEDMKKFQQLSKYPLVDKTGLDTIIDIELNCNLSDMNAINQELKKYDLKFIEEMGEQEFVVIKDRAPNKSDLTKR